MTGWRGECDLIDPMCGSGTIPVEAALIARNIAPGVFRKGFAFEKWVDFDSEMFDRFTMMIARSANLRIRFTDMTTVRKRTK